MFNLYCFNTKNWFQGGRTKTPGAPTKSGATKSVTPATPSSTSGTGTGAPGPLRISDLNKALSSLAGSPASDGNCLVRLHY